MKEFNVHIFFSLMQRLSIPKVQELLVEYEEELKKQDIVDINQVFKFLELKFKLVEHWRGNKEGLEDYITFKLIANKKIPIITAETFKEIDNLDKIEPNVQIELIGMFNEQERLNILNNFGESLSALTVQNFIICLEESNQRAMIRKFKDKIVEDHSNNSLFSFLASLKSSNQIVFLESVKDYLEALPNIYICTFTLGIYNENIESYFKLFKNFFESLDEEDLSSFISTLSGNLIMLCSQYFGDQINKVPANELAYKMCKECDSEILFEFWKNHPQKLNELSNAYFTYLISRLDYRQRLATINDFKSRYEMFSAEELLDFFQFDSDKMKLFVLTTYKEKIDETDDIKFINYVFDNVKSFEYRNKIFKLYKEKICAFSDENFIKFIKLSFDCFNVNIEDLKEFIVENFGDRLKVIQQEFIPELFKNSPVDLQRKYLDLLNENIQNLINDRIYLKELLLKVWGDLKEEIFKKFSREFGSFKAEDWYEIVRKSSDGPRKFPITVHEIPFIEEYLLTCQIDNLDFIDLNTVSTVPVEKRMLELFEINIQEKYRKYYQELLDAGENEKVLIEYTGLIDEIFNEKQESVLVNYKCKQMLVLLNVLFAKKIINDQDVNYLRFKNMYMSKLLENISKEDENNISLIKNSLFYRLIKGQVSSSTLLSMETLKGLIFFGKTQVSNAATDNILEYEPYQIEDFVANLTEEQVIGLNNRLFKQICVKLAEAFEDKYPQKSSIRNLAIKLYMTVGYQNAKRLIDLKVPFTRYEYFFNSIDISHIKLDKNGEPILDKKLIDFLFGSSILDNNTNMVRLLQSKIPEFEKRFVSVYNGWPLIYSELNGNVTVSRILKYFEANKVLLSPDEYRLEPYIGEITDEDSVEKARDLYKEMRNRKYSTIPKIKGDYDEEYSYEMLDLDDPLGLVVGYITRCCFLINGASRSSLFHSARSKDGRIFIVRRNGKLVAQSWVWRNGNLVCFDNVETTGSRDYDHRKMLEVYTLAAKKYFGYFRDY